MVAPLLLYVLVTVVYRKQIFASGDRKGKEVVKRIKELFKLDICEDDEARMLSIPIKAIYLYPVRGIQGIPVQQCQLTPSGLKFDRNWVIVRKNGFKAVANNNSHLITFLRQELILDPSNTQGKLLVRLSLQDQQCCPEVHKREMLLDYGALPEEQDLITNKDG